MITFMIFLLNILVLCLVFAAVLWIINLVVPIPLQLQRILCAIFGVLVLIWVLQALTAHSYRLLF